MDVIVSTPNMSAAPCAHPLCVLARSRLTTPHSCSLTYAMAAQAGEPLAATARVWCRECAIPRWMEPSQTWRRSWTGEPLCAECAAELELDAELRNFHALMRHTGSPWP